MDSPQLGLAARQQITEGNDRIVVSAASVFEIALKHRIGKLPEIGALIEDFSGHLARERFDELGISHSHALHAGVLAIDHKDPFDRMLIAQTQLEGLTLVSNEKLFDRFGVSRLWD